MSAVDTMEVSRLENSKLTRSLESHQFHDSTVTLGDVRRASHAMKRIVRRTPPNLAFSSGTLPFTLPGPSEVATWPRDEVERCSAAIINGSCGLCV